MTKPSARPSSKVQNAKRLWDIPLAMYSGAKLGILITLAHHLYHTIYDITPGIDFLTHRVAEWMGFTIAGMLVMGGVAVVHNWAVRRG